MDCGFLRTESEHRFQVFNIRSEIFCVHYMWPEHGMLNQILKSQGKMKYENFHENSLLLEVRYQNIIGLYIIVYLFFVIE